jgi:hypothetical protein
MAAVTLLRSVPVRARHAIFAFLLVSAPAFARHIAPVDPATDLRVYLPGSADVAAVSRALAGARRRLAAPTCQELFWEFQGSDGRPLTAALETLGQTGASYLGFLSFYNGDGAAPCYNRQLPILAFTVQGSRVIYICPQFAGMFRRDRLEAEAALIHEALHSLGLGENPPSSRSIQERIIRRCADAAVQLPLPTRPSGDPRAQPR